MADQERIQALEAELAKLDRMEAALDAQQGGSNGTGLFGGGITDVPPTAAEPDEGGVLDFVTGFATESVPKALGEVVSVAAGAFDFITDKAPAAIAEKVQRAGEISAGFDRGPEGQLVPRAEGAPTGILGVQQLKSLKEAINEDVSDEQMGAVAVRAGAGTVGGVAGFKVGVALAPWTFGTSLVLGPAIGATIGDINGIVTGKHLR